MVIIIHHIQVLLKNGMDLLGVLVVIIFMLFMLLEEQEHKMQLLELVDTLVLHIEHVMNNIMVLVGHLKLQSLLLRDIKEW